MDRHVSGLGSCPCLVIGQPLPRALASRAETNHDLSYGRPAASGSVSAGQNHTRKRSALPDGTTHYVVLVFFRVVARPRTKMCQARGPQARRHPPGPPLGALGRAALAAAAWHRWPVPPPSRSDGAAAGARGSAADTRVRAETDDGPVRRGDAARRAGRCGPPHRVH
eukprot:COSAG03_NODE_4358_length_1580_cov_0.839973_3_plen_167_part_00